MIEQDTRQGGVKRQQTVLQCLRLYTGDQNSLSDRRPFTMID